MKASKPAWTVITVGLLMLTAACGGSGDASSAASSAASGSSSSNSGPTTLTMAETPGGPLSFVTYGVQRGHFKAEGIDLQAKANPGGGTATVPALLQGDYDVLGLDLVSAITTIGRGLPVKMVSAGSATSEQANGDFAAVLVKNDSKIQGPQDFNGIKMGINALGNVNEIVIDNTLEKLGKPKRAISPVELPFPDILAAISRGDVDAGVVIEPFATIGQNQGMRVVDRPYVGLKPGIQIGTMVMTDSKIKQDPGVVDRFARAVKATAEDIKADPASFRAALPGLIKLDPALAQKVNLIQWRGDSDRASIELTGQLMKKYGLLNKEIDYDKSILPSRHAPGAARAARVASRSGPTRRASHPDPTHGCPAAHQRRRRASMTTTETARTVAPSAFEAVEVIQRAADLHDLVDGHGEENDRAGRIAEPVVEALYDSGAISVFTPRGLGGAEMTPRQSMDLFRTLSYADPSTGWVTMALGLATGLAGAFFDEDAAAELFSTPRLGIAGQGTRPGKAVPVKGGHLVTGEWSFASGIKHATHLHTAAQDTETGEARFFIVPVEQVTFIDNWDVLGLRGTGSIDYTLQDTFVPSPYSYPTSSTEPVTGGDLYRIGIGNFASLNHGGWALGVGRRLLDELSAMVQAKAGQPGGPAGSDSFAEQYAQAEVQLRAASALLYEVWEEIEATLARGEKIPLRLETLNRVALNNATWSTHDVAQFVYTTAGSTALRSGIVQRLFRDVHGGTQHISSSPMIMRSAGRELAGLAKGQRWVHFSLK
jgi:ABC-type nitrate/sulfonate/bicarbonate transport system substrate-binding protein/alkylation response protein AidB-like acyl-CoA dehydrogenase